MNTFIYTRQDGVYTRFSGDFERLAIRLWVNAKLPKFRDDQLPTVKL